MSKVFGKANDVAKNNDDCFLVDLLDKVIKAMENENLTVYENTNGQIVVKDMAMIGLENMD